MNAAVSNASASVAETWSTTPNRTVEAAGTTFAYRRLGSGGGVPLVMLNHSGATLDNFDPRRGPVNGGGSSRSDFNRGSGNEPSPRFPRFFGIAPRSTGPAPTVN